MVVAPYRLDASLTWKETVLPALRAHRDRTDHRLGQGVRVQRSRLLVSVVSNESGLGGRP
jgi:hypothetical protein